jgi:hypothetical protein
MVKCEKCGEWYSYKYECGCDKRVDSRDNFLMTYNINYGDEVEFIGGLVTRFDTYSYGQGSAFHVINEKTKPKRNFMMIHLNTILLNIKKYQVIRVNETIIK